MTFFAQRVEICARFVHGKPSVQPFLGGSQQGLQPGSFLNSFVGQQGIQIQTCQNKKRKKEKTKRTLYTQPIINYYGVFFQKQLWLIMTLPVRHRWGDFCFDGGKKTGCSGISSLVCMPFLRWTISQSVCKNRNMSSAKPV